MSRFGWVAPRPAEERKKPAGKRIAAAQMPSRASTSAIPPNAGAACLTAGVLALGIGLLTA
jgi:hypothetical protein